MEVVTKSHIVYLTSDVLLRYSGNGRTNPIIKFNHEIGISSKLTSHIIYSYIALPIENNSNKHFVEAITLCCRYMSAANGQKRIRGSKIPAIPYYLWDSLYEQAISDERVTWL